MTRFRSLLIRCGLAALLTAVLPIASSNAQSPGPAVGISTAIPAPPNPGVPPTPDELASLSKFLRRFTYALNRTQFVYHWFSISSSKHPERWSGILSPSDPNGYGYVESVSSVFWNDTYGQTADMFGAGLYAALDPVYTRGFGNGGSPDGWVLVQMHLPVGFRILDFSRFDASDVVPPEISKILSGIGCAASTGQSASVVTQLMNPNLLHSDLCRKAVRQIFRDQIGIHGFLYAYGSTNYLACRSPDPAQAPMGNRYRLGAFVITDASILNRDDVRIFSSKSTEDIEDRLRIQSFFYLADRDLGPQSADPVANAAVQAAFPQYNGWSWSLSNNCVGVTTGSCTPMLTFCSNSNPVVCKQGAAPSIPTPPYPRLISAKSPPVTQSNPPALLWADLDDGKRQTDPNLESWMKTNLFGCDPTTSPLTPLDDWQKAQAAKIAP